jgi:hypothetical protein
MSFWFLHISKTLSHIIPLLNRNYPNLLNVELAKPRLCVLDLDEF